MHVMHSIRAAGLLFAGAVMLPAQYQYPFQNPNLPIEAVVGARRSLTTRIDSADYAIVIDSIKLVQDRGQSRACGD
jgi:hypothetical protein